MGLVDGDPRVCKSNQLHVQSSGYPLLDWVVYLMNSFKNDWSFSCSSLFNISFKTMGNLISCSRLELTSTGYFSNSTGSSVNNCRFSPIIYSTGVAN